MLERYTLERTARPTDARDLREGVGAGSGHGRAVLYLVLMIGK